MNAKKAKEIRRAARESAPAFPATQYAPPKAHNRLFQLSNGSVDAFPIINPMRLQQGNPRQLVKLMKHLERTVGLDAVFDKLHADVIGKGIK